MNVSHNSHNSQLINTPFGTVTSLHYDDELFEAWHNDMTMHIGDIVVKGLRYYSITKTKKKMLTAYQIVKLYDQWTLLDKKKKINLANALSYKRCTEMRSSTEYNAWLQRVLPSSPMIIMDNKQLLHQLSTITKKECLPAAKVLRKCIDRYDLEIDEQTFFNEILCTAIFDRCFVLLTQ